MKIIKQISIILVLIVCFSCKNSNLESGGSMDEKDNADSSTVESKSKNSTSEPKLEPNDWSRLAKDIIGNELYGKNFSKALKNEINKVVSGKKTKNDVVVEFNNFFNNHSSTKDRKELKNALMSEISSKIDEAVLKTNK
jgi:hypothetical protein